MGFGHTGINMVSLSHFLILSAALFIVGTVGVLTRRNALIVFMSIELMLNGVALSFLAFSRFLGSLDGQVFVFMVITVAAAEAAVGLAIIIAIFRLKGTINIDEINLMKG